MKSKVTIYNILPLTLFSVILIVSAFVLYEAKENPSNNNIINSQLIGKKVPTIKIKKINVFEKKIKSDTLNFNEYTNDFFAVNFYASWCVPCRVEAPVIEELSKVIPIIGIAYKDKVQNTKKFLNDYGNPYHQIGLDDSGKIAIEWGVYGVPETFIVNANGKIIYRHAGPLLYKVFKSEVLPLIKRKQ